MRGRTTLPSFTAGGRKLPGGRAAIALSLALLAACGGPAVSAPSRGLVSDAPSATGTPAAVPTLGTKPPAGLTFQTYFVTVTASGNGSIEVLTAPASGCGLTVRAPSGAITNGAQIIANTAGVASWTFPPVTGHGEAILTVTCTQGGQTQSAQAQVLLP